MIIKTMTLGEKDFFHARPAAVVANTAKQYESVILLLWEGKVANVKDAFALMRMERFYGQSFDLMADGSDEEKALLDVSKAIETAFA
jgi:phosphotransferase system HPr (HPr) family protein